jgi:DNA-binding NtrC family response regulator
VREHTSCEGADRILEHTHSPLRPRSMSKHTIELGRRVDATATKQRVLEIPTLVVTVVSGPDAGDRSVATCETLSVGTAEGNDLVLIDETVSRYHAELRRVPAGVLLVDHRSTNGSRVGVAQIERAVIPEGTIVELGRTSLQIGDGPTTQLEVRGDEVLAGVHGRSPAMRRLMTRVDKAARSDIAVLLVGESGTGKEVIARAIHQLSERAKEPFVTVDCGAVSPSLVTSELFGHERGAFTGADKSFAGAFERADGGTLFLDEIGELPLEIQTHLLGVLERRTFRRLGGSKDIASDVRVLAATNRDLRADVNSGKFRLDLYYRIAVVTLLVPPLRERPEDIELLAQHFLDDAGSSARLPDIFAPAALATFRTHHWPGNVRELRNLVEASLAMGEPPPLWGAGNTRNPAPRPLPSSPAPNRPGVMAYKTARDQVLHHFEREFLLSLITAAGGNVAKAARMANMNRSHLFRMLRKHDLR